MLSRSPSASSGQAPRRRRISCHDRLVVRFFAAEFILSKVEGLLRLTSLLLFFQVEPLLHLFGR